MKTKTQTSKSSAPRINLDDVSSLRRACDAQLMVFLAGCLPHYCTVQSAPFHYEMANTLTRLESPYIEIIGFRGSAKSTFASLAYPLWSALSGEHNFIVLINDTSEQVKINMANIRFELDKNPFIRRVYPEIQKVSYTETDLLLSNGVRIIGRSRGQNIRGIRHREHRPDLVVVDDPENTLQVRTKENRDKTESWFNSEVVPAAREMDSKLIVIGNFLHNDGFMARLARNPLFTVIRIPLINEKGECAWKAKYPNKKALDDQRKKVGETAWAREYLLKIISEEDQIIKETDIKKYPNELLQNRDEKGNMRYKLLDSGYGGDLAISEKETADYTAFVGGYKVEWNGMHLLVLPRPLKKRMNFHDTQDAAVAIDETAPHGTKWFIEDIGYQRAAIQSLRKKGLTVFPIRPMADKRARLQSVAPWVIDGTVLFPEQGCEDLIQSIINFGIDEHDDDVDAFVYLVLGLINSRRARAVHKIDKL